MKTKIILLLGIVLLSLFGFSCDVSQAKTKTTIVKKTEFAAKRLDSYSRFGIEFVYYKIPAGLSREELVGVAQKLHQEEPEASLILVDDDSQVQEYIDFAKTPNPSYNDPELPREWADKHIVANLQRYLSGKFMLCEGYGYKEIAELK